MTTVTIFAWVPWAFLVVGLFSGLLLWFFGGKYRRFILISIILIIIAIYLWLAPNFILIP